jgi:ligand-binding SRPBCC domain-containing protein
MAESKPAAAEEAPDVAPKVEGKGVVLRVTWPHHIHNFQSTETTALIDDVGVEVAKGAVKDLKAEAGRSGVVLEEVTED